MRQWPRVFGASEITARSQALADPCTSEFSVTVEMECCPARAHTHRGAECSGGRMGRPVCGRDSQGRGSLMNGHLIGGPPTATPTVLRRSPSPPVHNAGPHCSSQRRYAAKAELHWERRRWYRPIAPLIISTSRSLPYPPPSCSFPLSFQGSFP